MICKHCNREMPEVGDFCPFCAAPKEAAPVEEEILIPAEEVMEEVPLEVEETAEEAGPQSGELSEETENEGVSEEAEGEEIEGEENADEEKPRRKLKLWQLLFIITCGVVLVGVLVCAVLFGMGVDLTPRQNELTGNASYTVTADKAERRSRNVVADVKGHKLTNGQLQLYYQNEVYGFLSQYYYYLSMIGLDLTQGLDTQPSMMAEDMTWQQFFLNNALNSWHTYTALGILAEEEGFQLDAQTQQMIDTMEANAEATALAYGFASAEEWIASELGSSVSLEEYLEFNTVYYVGNAYINSFYTDKYPTDDQIEAYYLENEATFTEEGITRDLGLNASVRHILIAPEGGTTDESGNTTYSEEEWAAAKAEAQRILDEWKNGDATEESFAALVPTYTDDGGSAATGGLYEDVNIDAGYVENFKVWASDASRKIGDTGIVETEFGYHIMYFVSGADYWQIYVGDQLAAQNVQDVLKAAMETYPMEVNYRKIALAELNLA